MTSNQFLQNKRTVIRGQKLRGPPAGPVTLYVCLFFQVSCTNYGYWTLVTAMLIMLPPE